MDPFFAGYTSNTDAASCQQCWFAADPSERQTGRVFYRVTVGGRYSYRLFYANIVDSTFSDGKHSAANRVLPSWRIHRLRAAVCGDLTPAEELFVPLTFAGAGEKTVAPGEFFRTDPVSLSAETGAYLCVEMTFSGSELPYLPETRIPIRRLVDGRFETAPECPTPFLVGCDRPVREHFAFIGDSITMGCGTPVDSHAHWAARIAEKLGADRAFWNLGIGYARGADAATDGAWLFKAKQADFVNVCFGVNDVLWSRDSADRIFENICRIVRSLQEAGCRVGVFTLPPFRFEGEMGERWYAVNRRIREELPGTVEYVFDTVPILGKEPPEAHMDRFGPHPDPVGCEALAEAFVRFAREKGIA